MRFGSLHRSYRAAKVSYDYLSQGTVKLGKLVCDVGQEASIDPSAWSGKHVPQEGRNYGNCARDKAGKEIPSVTY